VSDEPGSTFIAHAGGIWAGMSGSPVYVGGKLIGAVAYGLTAGPSFIGGVTPAEDMGALVGVTPSGARTGQGRLGVRQDAPLPLRVALTPGMRTIVAARTGSAAAATGGMRQLRLPVTVSGLSRAAMRDLQRALARRGVLARLMSGSAHAAPRGPAVLARPAAGGNFVTALSYGELTFAATGTTTWVCGDRALAFGHPMLEAGRVAYGANDADSLAIVPDPLGGPFKLANVGPAFGIVDQDRIAGVRARLGIVPTTTPIVSRVTATDTGATRSGRTDVVAPDMLPMLALYQLYGDLDVTLDRSGPGTALVGWVIRGHTPDGRTFQLRRGDRFASTSDISSSAVGEVAQQLDTLINNSLKRVIIDSVSLTADARRRVDFATITGVTVSRNGSPFLPRTELRLRPGDRLVVRAKLQRYRGAAQVRDVAIRVPAGASGFGTLTVASADRIGSCATDVTMCPSLTTVAQLVDILATAPRNDDVQVQLAIPAPDGSVVTTAATGRVTVALTGRFDIPVTVGSGGGAAPGAAHSARAAISSR
jgi:hypothetical protein